MRWKVSLALVAVAAALWLLWPSSPRERAEPPREEPAVQREAEPADRAVMAPIHARVERPRLFVPESEREDAPRLEIDVGPWRPERETRGAHERRLRLADAFDRFCDETGMSDERAQELLLLLYDYQETTRAIDAEFERRKPFRDKWQYEYFKRKNGADWILVRHEAGLQLRDMLSDDEMRAWDRTMEEAAVWIMLSEPMIQPVDP